MTAVWTNLHAGAEEAVCAAFESLTFLETYIIGPRNSGKSLFASLLAAEDVASFTLLSRGLSAPVKLYDLNHLPAENKDPCICVILDFTNPVESFAFAHNFLHSRDSNSKTFLIASKLDLLITECIPEKRKTVVSAFTALAASFSVALLGLSSRDKSLQNPLLKFLFAGDRNFAPLLQNTDAVAANKPIVFIGNVPADLPAQLRVLETAFGKLKPAMAVENVALHDVIDAAIERKRGLVRGRNELIDF